MSVEAAASVQVHRPLPAEEQGRADFYALFARLLHSAPDAGLLAAIAASAGIPDGDPDLAKAWSELAMASSAMDAAAAHEEYHDLFEGMGAAAVSIYSGFYVGATAVDHPRVRIHTDLVALGLGRQEHATEPEDHWAGLFDTMRVLVAGGAGRAYAALGEQRRFFQSHLEPGVAKFFTCLAAAPRANYYRRVAAVGLAFMAIESESFQLG